MPHSGPHATVVQTVLIRGVISKVLQQFKIETMLDAACGDMTWMPLLLDQHPRLQYTGVDVVRALVQRHQTDYPQHRFYHADLTEHVPQRYDLIHSRETLNHLKTTNVLTVLENFKRSGSRYLLMNNAPAVKRNRDIIGQNGMYRGINWMLKPYSLTPLHSWPIDQKKRNYVLVQLN